MILSRLFSELEVGSDSELLMSLLYKQKGVESSTKPEPTDECSAITLYKVREQIILVIIYIYIHTMQSLGKASMGSQRESPAM